MKSENFAMFPKAHCGGHACGAMIPSKGNTMLQFSSFTAESAAVLRPLFAAQPSRACDYTVGANYQWRCFYKSEYAVSDGMLIIRADYGEEGGHSYMLPVGSGDAAKAFDLIEEDAAAAGQPLVFFTPKEGLALLRARYGGRITEETPLRFLFDYLYDVKAMQTFAGKKLHGQKNHLNRFLKENPLAEFVPVTEETLPEAERFLEEYEKEAGLDVAIEIEEMARARELLHYYRELGQSAGFIKTETGVAALAVGEVLGDTLYVHVEKARLSYHGAYQAIAAMYPRYATNEETVYVNREDDSGDDGLRQSKLAYQPVAFVEKYRVCVK